MRASTNSAIWRASAGAGAIVVMVAACGGSPSSHAPPASPTESTASDATGVDQEFPDVIAVVVDHTGDGVYRFDVTVSSPYDSPQRYADAFRVVDLSGGVLGVRELLHDHAAEQPFTRSLADVAIPAGTDRVMVEARDSINGWGGSTFEVVLDP